MFIGFLYSCCFLHSWFCLPSATSSKDSTVQLAWPQRSLCQRQTFQKIRKAESDLCRVGLPHGLSFPTVWLFSASLPIPSSEAKDLRWSTLCRCGSCTVQLSSIQLDMMQSMNPCWSFPASAWEGTILLHWGHCPSDFLGPFRGRLAKSVGTQVWDSSCKQRGLGPSTAPTNRTTPGRQLTNSDLYLYLYIYNWFHLYSTISI